MKGLKLGGGRPSPSSARPPKTETSQPSPPPAAAPQAPSSPKPSARPNGRNDGFAASTSQASATQAPARPPPGGKDVTASFASNPVQFASTQVLNAYNMTPPHGVPLPTPSATFVPAAQSVVTLNAHQRPGGNANLSLGPPNGKGAQVNYLHYLSEGEGRFAGLQGVPQRPGADEPSMVITGPLNGCAVHAFHDKNTQTLSFVHHANFSKNGKQELQDFLKAHPNLSHAASLEPKDYSHSTGHRDETTGATAFAHYQQPTSPNGQGQWYLMGQLNDWKNGAGPDGRPELKRPSAFTGSPLMMIPIPPPRAE
jgi:hypothetical protein